MLRVGDMLTLTPPTIPPPCRQALMKQFKDSVLDEDGLSVRALTEESARRVADQAADGILDLVSRLQNYVLYTTRINRWNESRRPPYLPPMPTHLSPRALKLVCLNNVGVADACLGG